MATNKERKKKRMNASKEGTKRREDHWLRTSDRVTFIQKMKKGAIAVKKWQTVIHVSCIFF